MLAVHASLRLGTNRLFPLLAATGPFTSLLRMSSQSASSEPGPVEHTIHEKVCTLSTHGATVLLNLVVLTDAMPLISVDKVARTS